MLNNLTTMLLLLGILGIMYVTNLIFGIVIGTKNAGFSWKKFGSGIGKAILLVIAFTSFCFCIEALPLVLARIGIIMPENLVTLAEVVGMAVTAYKKYAMDCIDKIKTILGLGKVE